MKKTFNSNIIHWIWCIFLVIYIFIFQYIYAISDRQFVVDHDYWICRRTFTQYNENPSGHIFSLIKDILFKRKDCYFFSFTNLITSLHFYIFGRTLFIFKMSNLYSFIIMALSVYFIVYYLTKKELFGILASIILLNLPIMVNNMRRHFPFITLAAMVFLAIFFILKDMSLNKKINCIFFLIFMWLSTLIHPSAFIYYFFIYLYFFMLKGKNEVIFFLMFIFFLLVFAWNYSDFIFWTTENPSAPFKSPNFLENFFNRIISIKIPLIYPKLKEIFSRKILIFFIANIGVLLFLKLVKSKLYKLRINREFKFIFIFVGYVFFLYLISFSDTQIDCYIVFFVLFVIAFDIYRGNKLRHVKDKFENKTTTEKIIR